MRYCANTHTHTHTHMSFTSASAICASGRIGITCSGRPAYLLDQECKLCAYRIQPKNIWYGSGGTLSQHMIHAAACQSCISISIGCMIKNTLHAHVGTSVAEVDGRDNLGDHNFNSIHA